MAPQDRGLGQTRRAGEFDGIGQHDLTRPGTGQTDHHRQFEQRQVNGRKNDV